MDAINNFENYFEDIEPATALKATTDHWKAICNDSPYPRNDQASCQRFYDGLDMIPSLMGRIEYLRTTEYNLKMENQPEAVLMSFDGIRDSEEAMLVALAFKARFGTIAICREATVERNYPSTLLDCIMEDKGPVFVEAYTAKLLIEAMKLVGFKQADDVEETELVDCLCADTFYARFVSKIWNYSYLMINLENKWIASEVNQYLFHPSRVGKWLELHPDGDIENYIR